MHGDDVARFERRQGVARGQLVAGEAAGAGDVLRQWLAALQAAVGMVGGHSERPGLGHKHGSGRDLRAALGDGDGPAAGAFGVFDSGQDEAVFGQNGAAKFGQDPVLAGKQQRHPRL